jgi:hypothetical protein
LTLLVSAVWTAGDQRTPSTDDARMELDRAFQGAVTQDRQAQIVTPFLRGVSWSDVGDDGSFEGWVDTVSQRPQRAGPFTLLSYYEIVAVNVRIRVNGADPSGRRAVASDNTRGSFRQLQRTTSALRTMVRDDARTDPRRTVDLSRTALSRIVVDGFSIEGNPADRGGHLRSRLMVSAQSGEGWSLHDLHVEASNGRQLTIASAEWRKDGSLTAAGMYTVTQGSARRTGRHGCFAVDVGDAFGFRRIPASNASGTACAGIVGVANDQSIWYGADPRELVDQVSMTSPAARFTEQLLRVLPIYVMERSESVWR